MFRFVFLSKKQKKILDRMIIFRQNDIKRKYLFLLDIRLAETKFHLGVKKTGFKLHFFHMSLVSRFYVVKARPL